MSDLRRPAIEAIKYFIGVAFAKRRSRALGLGNFTPEEFAQQNSQLFTGKRDCHILCLVFFLASYRQSSR